MKQLWMTAFVSFALVGFAAVVSATAIAVAAESPDARQEGRAMMVDAQHRLALAIKR